MSTYSPTARQLEVLRWIRGYMIKNGYAPCQREIAEGTGSRKSNVNAMLVELERRGLIKRIRCLDRAIEVLIDIPVPLAPDGEPLYFVPAPTQEIA